jgi:hypothetical protein
MGWPHKKCPWPSREASRYSERTSKSSTSEGVPAPSALAEAIHKSTESLVDARNNACHLKSLTGAFAAL